MNCSSKSIAGRRANNEDSCGIYTHSDGTLLLVVADGMGGHQAGEVASGLALEAVQCYFETEQHPDSPYRFLKYATGIANVHVCRKAENSPEYAGMGTTLVMGMVCANTLYTANVGDSRLYLYHNGVISQVTKDHAYVQELLDSGFITEPEAKVHPLRHMITRCIGNRISVEPDLFTTNLSDGDIVLLCSDGLSGVLEPDALASILSDKEQSAEALADRLVSAAYDAGSEDNITVCLYFHRTEASE